MGDLPSVFRGHRDGCLSALSGCTVYYTYVLRRPDGRPFYVGKGIGARVFNHENEARHPYDRRSNTHKLNVIRSILKGNEGIEYEVDRVFDDELQAYQREEELIRQYRRLHEGGPLTNRHPGGGSKSGSSPYSKEKHSATLGGIPEDDPETAILNRFVLGIGPMRSIVLKPISRFKVKPTLLYPTKSVGPSLRQAIALASTTAANGIVLSGDVSLPRTVMIEGIPAFVENGVSCDIATSGMARVLAVDEPRHEVFRLTEYQCRVVVGLIGLLKAENRGIALPSVSTGLRT